MLNLYQTTALVLTDFVSMNKKALQATNDTFHTPGLTPKGYCKSWLHLVCDPDTVGRRKVEMETGKGIKVRDAAMPQWHCYVVTDELPQDQGDSQAGA